MSGKAWQLTSEKREKKAVEAFVVTEKKETEELVVPAGSGERLGDIENVKIKKDHEGTVLAGLHQLMHKLTLRGAFGEEKMKEAKQKLMVEQLRAKKRPLKKPVSAAIFLSYLFLKMRKCLEYFSFLNLDVLQRVL